MPLKYRVTLLEGDADDTDRELEELRSLLRWLLGILLTGALGAITALVVLALAAQRTGP